MAQKHLTFLKCSFGEGWRISFRQTI